MLRLLVRLGSALLLLIVVTGTQTSVGQELSCDVQINRSQLSGSDFGFLDDLQRQIREYVNQRNWTDDEFLAHEQIACSMNIIVLEAISLSEFRARVIVTSRRPIHGTSQSTVVFRINDSNWRFEYGRGTSLNFNLRTYNSLTSVLDFYAYVILGYDYDTFSKLGGTPHFEKAKRVADQARTSGDPGWASTGSQRNRQQLIQDLLAQSNEPLRTAYYQYHRRGLDRFVKEPAKARAVIFEVVETVQTLDRNLSNSYPLNLFFSTKHEELVAIFREGEFQEQAYNLLTQANPSNSSTYNQIVE